VPDQPQADHGEAEGGVKRSGEQVSLWGVP
jgi:hypothetical protein